MFPAAANRAGNACFVRLFGNGRKRSGLGAKTLGRVLAFSREKPAKRYICAWRSLLSFEIFDLAFFRN
jgi:hypothetical protein